MVVASQVCMVDSKAANRSTRDSAKSDDDWLLNEFTTSDTEAPF